MFCSNLRWPFWTFLLKLIPCDCHYLCFSFRLVFTVFSNNRRPNPHRRRSNWKIRKGLFGVEHSLIAGETRKRIRIVLTGVGSSDCSFGCSCEEGDCVYSILTNRGGACHFGVQSYSSYLIESKKLIIRGPHLRPFIKIVTGDWWLDR